MAYVKTVWENGATALSAENMNKIENELEALDTGKVEKETGKGLMSDADKTKLDGVASGAEVNQNAFSNVKVGSTTVAADQKTDTLELVAGTNVTLTPDATNDKVTIAATDTKYSNATTSSAGLMSAADKTKLDALSGIVLGSTVYNDENVPPIPVSQISVYIPALVGKSFVIAGAQDAGNPILRTSLVSATGKLTVYLSDPVTVMRINYIAW